MLSLLCLGCNSAYTYIPRYVYIFHDRIGRNFVLRPDGPWRFLSVESDMSGRIPTGEYEYDCCIRPSVVVFQCECEKLNWDTKEGERKRTNAQTEAQARKQSGRCIVDFAIC
jgi:hypothetical protein